MHDNPSPKVKAKHTFIFSDAVKMKLLWTTHFEIQNLLCLLTYKQTKLGFEIVRAMTIKLQ